MRGSGICSGKRPPLRIEPDFGQGPENGSEPSARSEAWNVLQQDVSGSHLANDSGQLEEEPAAGPGDPGALAGDAEVLAREASSHDVHESTPGSPVEGRDVVPDGGVLERPVEHAVAEDGLGVGLFFDEADGAEAADELGALLEPGRSGEEGEDVEAGVGV